MGKNHHSYNDNNYSILLTGILIGLAIGGIWVKLSCLEKQGMQKSQGKHITTSYDDSGRLVDYLEMPVDSSMGSGMGLELTHPIY